MAFLTLNAQEALPSLPQETPTKDKNGFTLGVELNLGSATLMGDKYGLLNSNVAYSSFLGNYKLENFAFDGGLNVGYQHYFDKEALGVKKAFGIEASFYLGIGSPIEDTLSYEYTKGYPTYYKVSFLPIKTGFDVNFLWDFWQSGEHTLGMKAGLGYRLSYFVSLKNSSNASNYWNGTYNQNFSGLLLNEFYPQIGINYYFGQHQFSLTYRFGGIMSTSSNREKNKFDSTWMGRGESVYFETSITQSNYFSLGYSYLF